MTARSPLVAVDTPRTLPADERARLQHEADRLANHPDVIRTPTLNERATSLRYIAELSIVEGKQPGAPDLGGCTELIVRSLASYAVTGDVMVRFEALKDAVRDLQRCTADPRGYAADHDWPTTERALDTLDEQLAGAVDAALWDLLSPTPACRLCRRTRPRESWRPALWPGSAYCQEHRP